ncbi:MAG: D-alanyl-D-alanine carboxypeptidase/D-alanyl-D-alanine-endopeptidase [Bacteroidaceae bacterium]|nr:D-alanyl-D-alanine carboxypeptidase/D-alanyl-D-alanine-endopeptidase [Bacteroidaceae bacterium]
MLKLHIIISAFVGVLLMPLGLHAQESKTQWFLLDEGGFVADSAREGVVLSWPETLSARLDELIEGCSVVASSQFGIEVFDLTTESIVYQKNERQRFRPASTMKVFTGTAALSVMEESYPFVTKIGYTGQPQDNEWRIRQYRIETISDSDTVRKEVAELEPIVKRSRVLYGNICVKGSMDPMFSESDVRRFADAVRGLGVDTIYGGLVLDLSLKDTLAYGEGWCWDDVNPVLTPLLVDKKDVFASHFLKYIKQAGIVITGSTTKNDYPVNTTDLAECRHELRDILTRTMKNSDNAYAECIFYKLGAEVSKQKGVSAKSSREAVNRIIKRVGRNPEDYYIADGSGLSLYNYLSPEVEIDVLRYAFRRPFIFNTLYEKLPVAGVDGTLRGRMKGSSAQYNVHAKTGTLSGVSTLAGYCRAPNGHWLCFAIMSNGLKNSAQGKSLQDRICTAMCSIE